MSPGSAIPLCDKCRARPGDSHVVTSAGEPGIWYCVVCLPEDLIDDDERMHRGERPEITFDMSREELEKLIQLGKDPDTDS